MSIFQITLEFYNEYDIFCYGYTLNDIEVDNKIQYNLFFIENIMIEGKKIESCGCIRIFITDITTVPQIFKQVLQYNYDCSIRTKKRKYNEFFINNEYNKCYVFNKKETIRLILHSLHNSIMRIQLFIMYDYLVDLSKINKIKY